MKLRPVPDMRSKGAEDPLHPVFGHSKHWPVHNRVAKAESAADQARTS